MPRRLAICYPWTSEFIWTRCTHTMLNLQRPEDYEIRFFRGDGWCSARRHNHCLEQAVDWGSDLICIIGADQIYESDLLLRLTESYSNGCEVVAASVPIRGHVANQGTKPFQTLCWRYRPDERGNVVLHSGLTHKDVEVVGPQHGERVRIDGCGTGVLLFPRSALNDLRPPWFFESPMEPSFERRACADWPFVARLQSEAKLTVWCDTTIKVKHLHVFEIDETFSERFADWSQEGDPLCCGVDDPEPEIINQVRVSPSLPFYEEKFRRRYGLRPYTTPFLPAFFFGCYTPDDLKAIQQHARTCVVVWAGSDVQRMRKALEGTGRAPGLFGSRVRHVAISNFIADDLDVLGIPYKRLPLCNVDEERFKPVPLGKAVYCYCPAHDREKYGGPILDQVRAALPDVEFIVQETLDPAADMPAVYAKCGVGLRLTQHDGLSNGCAELGLIGRKVVWNGDTPNAIKWDSVADVVRAVEDQLVGSPDEHLISQAMRAYLALPPDWKTVAFHVEQPKTPMLTIPPEVAAEPYDYRRYFDFRYAQGEQGAGGPEPGGREAEFVCGTAVAEIKRAECESVVEVGCGSMVRWRELPCPPERYMGLDVSSEALKFARAKFPKAEFVLSNVVLQGAPTADAVLCIDVMQHVKPEDFDRMMEELLFSAKKLLFIKTTVDFEDGYYQFNHARRWQTLLAGLDGWQVNYRFTPGGTNRRMMVLTREMVPA